MSNADQLLTIFWIVLGVILVSAGVNTATNAIEPAVFGMDVPVSIVILWHGASAMVCFYLAAASQGATLGDLLEFFEG